MEEDLDLDLEVDIITNCAILDQDCQTMSEPVGPNKSLETSDEIDGSAVVSGILSDVIYSVVDHVS